MRKNLLLTILMFWITGLELAAQQRPHYSQYIFNNYILNPALTGIENYTDLKLSHRHQWAGIDGAPVTTYLTLHGPLGKDDYRTTATSFEVPGENPRGKAYWENYTAPKPHHGIGLQVVNDKTGPLNNFSAQATYAYHIGLTPKTSLAAGVGAGIRNISLDRSKLDFGNTQVDPAVYSSGQLNRLKPDVSAGLWLYSANYFIGASAQQILPQTIQFSDATVTAKGKLIPHFFLTGGYLFFLSDDLTWLPSIMLKYVQPSGIQADLNAKLQYRDRVWIGAGVRSQDGITAMTGVNISGTMHVGYAYDYTTSRLSSVSRGTHEILIGFLLGNKFGDLCPRNVW